jgi:hypothetical protein
VGPELDGHGHDRRSHAATREQLERTREPRRPLLLVPSVGLVERRTGCRSACESERLGDANAGADAFVPSARIISPPPEQICASARAFVTAAGVSLPCASEASKGGLFRIALAERQWERHLWQTACMGTNLSTSVIARTR